MCWLNLKLIFISLLYSFNISCLKTQISNKNLTYQPTWESLDTRPIPAWFDEAKLGIFVHFGVFSVPSFGSEWFWLYLQSGDTRYVNFMKNNYPPNFQYQEFASQLKAEYLDVNKWAQLFLQSGAKYVVLTSKHHEGYTLWKSNTSWNWNSVDIGPHRNILREFVDAIRKVGLKVGIYFSFFDWFHPLYLLDKTNKFNTSYYVEEVSNKQIREIVTDYKPDYIWFDGDWEANSDYWQTKQLLAWLYSESPVKDTIVVNDRLGMDSMCAHGDIKTCADKFHPSILPNFKYESCYSLDKFSWGYRREMTINDVMTFEEVIHEMIYTISYGGNFLLNAGPTKEGNFNPIFEDRFIKLGKWMAINGESIYGLKICPIQKQLELMFTCKSNEIFVFFFEWPSNNTILINDVHSNSKTSYINILNSSKNLTFIQESSKLTISLDASYERTDLVGWVLKLVDFSMQH